MLMAAALVALGAHADDKVHVVTKSADNAFAISEVQRIDFAGDALNVVSTNGESTTYAFDDVVKITFDESSTAIQTVAAPGQGRLTFTVANDGTTLTVNGWDSSAQTSLQLYSVGGANVASQAHWSGQSVDISSLPHGVYVLKVGNRTAKFRK